MLCYSCFYILSEIGKKKEVKLDLLSSNVTHVIAARPRSDGAELKFYNSTVGSILLSPNNISLQS